MSKKKTALNILGATSLLFVGVAIGSSAEADGQAAKAKPEVKVKTETKTVYRDRTPAVCLDALDNGDTALMTAGDGFELTAQIFDAFSTLDVNAAESVTAELEALRPQMESDMAAYASASEECRAAAGAQ